MKEFNNMVENTRVSVLFPKDKIKITKLNLEVPPIQIIKQDDMAKIKLSQAQLLNALTQKANSLSPLVKRDTQDIIYKIIEFGKFIDVINKHALKEIAVQLYFSIIHPYIFFIEILTEKVNKIGIEHDQNDVFKIAGDVMSDMLTYYGNILHCNLGFFEERGFYNNIIGLASNVELAYNQYANFICKTILSDSEKKQNLQVCCSITSDKEPLICAYDCFNEIKQPLYDKKSLININIPVSYVFKYKTVSQIIIHEVAHYVGFRNREKRAEVLCKTFTSIICDFIFQDSNLPISTDFSENTNKFFNEYESTEKFVELYKKFKQNMQKFVFEWIWRLVQKECQNNYYLNNTMKVLVSVLNKMPFDDYFINAIVQQITNFRFWYYENIEDYYIENLDMFDNDDIIKVFSQISDNGIIRLNKKLLRNAVETNLRRLISEPQSTKDSSLNVKECNIYAINMVDFIDNIYDSISEAYSDLMMIVISDMTFEDYLEVMNSYGKTVENIINEKDYMTWLRISFVASYMKKSFKVSNINENFKIFIDIGVIDHISEYFESLRPEFDKALNTRKENAILNNFITTISSENSENQCFEAIYNMFFNIREICED